MNAKQKKASCPVPKPVPKPVPAGPCRPLAAMKPTKKMPNQSASPWPINAGSSEKELFMHLIRQFVTN